LHLKEIDVEMDRKASRHRDPVIDGRNRERQLVRRKASLIARRATVANASDKGANREGKPAGHHGRGTTGDGEHGSRDRLVGASKEGRGQQRLDPVGAHRS